MDNNKRVLYIHSQVFFQSSLIHFFSHWSLTPNILTFRLIENDLDRPKGNHIKEI